MRIIAILCGLYILLMIGLQLLQYAFLPAIDPHSIDRPAEALKVIWNVNKGLLIECTIGAFLLYWMNNLALKEVKLQKSKKRRANLILTITSVLIVLIRLYLFSRNYYDSAVM